MRKKDILVLILALIIAGGVSARGEKDAIGKQRQNRFEIGVGYHRITETQKVSGVEMKTTMPSLAINFVGVTFYTEKVGASLYANLYSRKN